MANKRVLVVCDTETTGLDPAAGHEIVQCAAKALNAWDFSPHHSGLLNVYLSPQRKDKASAEAINLIGSVWDKACGPDSLHPKIGLQKVYDYFVSCNPEKNFMGKPLFVGHNKDFDLGFLIAQMIEYKVIATREEVPWHFISLDTIALLFALWESDPSLNNFKLDTLLGLLGIKRTGKHHDAVEDVELTAQAFVRIMGFMRKAKKQMRVATASENKESQAKAPKAGTATKGG